MRGYLADLVIAMDHTQWGDLIDEEAALVSVPLRVPRRMPMNFGSSTMRSYNQTWFRFPRPCGEDLSIFYPINLSTTEWWL